MVVDSNPSSYFFFKHCLIPGFLLSCSDELRGLQSVEDIEGKRREIVEELAQIRRETRVRNSCFPLLHSPLSVLSLAPWNVEQFS